MDLKDIGMSDYMQKGALAVINFILEKFKKKHLNTYCNFILQSLFREASVLRFHHFNNRAA